MSIKKRLDLVIKELGMTGRAFEREVGLANGSYSSIGEGVGAEKLNKIFVRFPQLSADWLVRGVGEMLRNNEKTPENVRQMTDIDKFGSVFAGKTDDAPVNSLNREEGDEMKTILYQLAALVSAQQQDITKLIAELEQNGKRTDRLMTIVEQQGYGQDGTLAGIGAGAGAVGTGVGSGIGAEAGASKSTGVRFRVLHH